MRVKAQVQVLVGEDVGGAGGHGGVGVGGGGVGMGMSWYGL